MTAIHEYESKGNIHLDVSVDPKPLAFHRRVGELAATYAPTGGTMIDIGCGLGESSSVAKAARSDLAVTVADAYQVCLDKASSWIDVEATILMDENEFSISTMTAKRFDVAVLSHVLEHTTNPAQAVLDVLDVVNPGGHFILAVPNPVRPDVFISSARQRHYVNRGHAVAWDRSHFMNFLEEILGLDVVEYASDEVKVLPRTLFAQSQMLDRFQERLADVLPWWSFSHIAVIRKPER